MITTSFSNDPVTQSGIFYFGEVGVGEPTKLNYKSGSWSFSSPVHSLLLLDNNSFVS